ncbi:MAG: hypothetical protein Q7R95_11395 [bacterium]|nr:hypothetical protein [bacterium]
MTEKLIYYPLLVIVPWINKKFYLATGYHQWCHVTAIEKYEEFESWEIGQILGGN